MKSMARIWFSIVLLAVVGCRSHEMASIGVVSQSSYAERLSVDSIVVHDSVFIREKSDTLFCTRYRTMYKERLRRDTIMLCDTIYVERIVEKERDGGSNGINCYLLLLLLFVVPVVLWRTGLLKCFMRIIKKL